MRPIASALLAHLPASHLLRVLLPLALLVALALPALGPASRLAVAQSAGGTLSILAQPVDVAPSGGSFAPGRDGQTISLGDTVRTGSTGSALLTLFDGSEIQLVADSQVQLSTPGNGQPGVSLFQVAGTTINHIASQAAGQTFQTDTPVATALVRGTTYAVTVRQEPASGPVTARSASAQLNPTALSQWTAAAAANDVAATQSLAANLADELAPVVVPGAPVAPSGSASTTSQVRLTSVSGNASPADLVFPRAVAGSSYWLLREVTYAQDGQEWQDQTWQDPATGQTWDTYTLLGTAYPQVGEALYVDNGNLIRVRTWHDPASGDTWNTFENLGTATAPGAAAPAPAPAAQSAAAVGAAAPLAQASPAPTTTETMTVIVALDGVVTGISKTTGTTVTLDQSGAVFTTAGVILQPTPTPTPTPSSTATSTPTSTPSATSTVAATPTRTPLPATATPVPATATPQPTGVPGSAPAGYTGGPSGPPSAPTATSNPLTPTPAPTIPAGVCGQGTGAVSGSPAATLYQVDDNTQQGGPTFSWIDATGGSPVSGLESVDDQCAGPVTLPFNFPYYGQTFNLAYINANGMLTFENGTSVYTNQAIPSASTPPLSISGLWDDLDSRCRGAGSNNPTTPDGIFYTTGGRGSGQYAVFEWLNWDHYGCPQNATYTFEIILYANGNIVFQYQTMQDPNNVTSASVGIQNQDGTIGVSYGGCSPNCTVANVPGGRAVRFVPGAVATPTPTPAP